MATARIKSRSLRSAVGRLTSGGGSGGFGVKGLSPAPGAGPGLFQGQIAAVSPTGKGVAPGAGSGPDLFQGQRAVMIAPGKGRAPAAEAGPELFQGQLAAMGSGSTEKGVERREPGEIPKWLARMMTPERLKKLKQQIAEYKEFIRIGNEPSVQQAMAEAQGIRQALEQRGLTPMDPGRWEYEFQQEASRRSFQRQEQKTLEQQWREQASTLPRTVLPFEYLKSQEAVDDWLRSQGLEPGSAAANRELQRLQERIERDQEQFGLLYGVHGSLSQWKAGRAYLDAKAKEKQRSREAHKQALGQSQQEVARAAAKARIDQEEKKKAFWDRVLGKSSGGAQPEAKPEEETEQEEKRETVFGPNVRIERVTFNVPQNDNGRAAPVGGIDLTDRLYVQPSWTQQRAASVTEPRTVTAMVRLRDETVTVARGASVTESATTAGTCGAAGPPLVYQHATIGDGCKERQEWIKRLEKEVRQLHERLNAMLPKLDHGLDLELSKKSELLAYWVFLCGARRRTLTDELCGPDVTDWFLEDLQRQLTHVQFKNFGIGVYDIHDFKYQAANLLAYKWMDFRWPGCGTKRCKGTVNLAGICLHKTQLGNIAFAVVAELGRPTDLPGAELWPREIARRGSLDGESAVKMGHWLFNAISNYPWGHSHGEQFGIYAGAERANNLAAFGVGVALAKRMRAVLYRFPRFHDWRRADGTYESRADYGTTQEEVSKFREVLGELLGKSEVLSQFRSLYNESSVGENMGGAMIPFSGGTLRTLPFFGGFDTGDCVMGCKRVHSGKFSLGRDSELKVLYKAYEDDGGDLDFEDWRELMFEDYG